MYTIKPTSLYNSQVLSDGRIIKKGNVYWVKVEPIVWLVDEKDDIAISERILCAGISLVDSHSQVIDSFAQMDIKKFLNLYFAKDIIPSKTNEIIDVEPLEEAKEKLVNEYESLKNKKVKIENTEIVKSLFDNLNKEEKLKPIILSKDNNSNITKIKSAPKTTSVKTILKSYELEDGNYQIYTCYVGEDTYKDILVKWDIDGNVDTLKLTCKPSVANLDNEDLSVSPLKTYQKQFKDEDDFAVHYNSFIEESEIEFAEKYNVVEAKTLSPLLEEKYGKQTFYTVEQINSILDNSKKGKGPIKVKTLKKNN